MLRRWWRITWQVGLLTLISMAGNRLAAWSRLPIPGSVLGLLILLALLGFKVIPLEWVDAGADWLLQEMLLFFVPAAVGVIQYQHVLATSGLRLLTVILLGTVAVMTATGLGVEVMARRKAGEQA